ncbi:MAG: carbon monoxide dehydrogenase subunit G [Deltaproteobacteria bacterium]|nr:carbon monoxide dehydrogenase subunit G [Deltaproteobacteria bacterium]
MKIEGSYTFKASRKRVWDLLLDPKIMAQCMPGCEGLEEVGPDQYEATMKIGIAAVKGTYKGKVSIKEKQAPVHYVLSGEGSGGPGFIQGEMAMDLDEKNGETILRYSADAKVGGLIAGVGQRMIGGIAKVTVEQFFKKMESFI